MEIGITAGAAGGTLPSTSVMNCDATVLATDSTSDSRTLPVLSEGGLASDEKSNSRPGRDVKRLELQRNGAVLLNTSANVELRLMRRPHFAG